MKSLSGWFSRWATKTTARKCMKVALFVLVAAALVMSTVAAVAAPADAAPKMKVQKSQHIRAQFRFGDVDESRWEFQYVAEMKGKGVIKGYDDGTFRPNASINQAEALVMALRLLGLEEQAKTSASLGLGIPGLEAVPWATGYADLGLKLGLVNASEFRPNKAASRAWVTALLVKALDLLDVEGVQPDDEAEDDEEAVLLRQFSDLVDVPETLRAAIAKALGCELVTGYPDKTFKPNKPVTRAEMAALLSRFDLRIPFPTNPYEVRGRVTAVGEQSITIAPWWRDNPVVVLPWLNQQAERHRHRVRTGNDAGFGENAQMILPILPVLPTNPPVSEEKTYEVSEDALILKNGKPAELSDIAVGDDVRMLLNDEGVVTLIVAKGALWWEVRGEVTKITSSPKTITVAMQVYQAEHDEEDEDEEDEQDEEDEDENGKSWVTKERTFKVADDVRVEYKGRIVQWSDIAVGDLVRMRLSGDEVVAVEILPGYRTVKGTVKSAPDDDLKMVIEDDDGDEITLDVSVTAEVRHKGKVLGIEDIKIGDEVKVVVERGAAIFIEIKDTKDSQESEERDEDENEDEEGDEEEDEDEEDEEESRENEFSGEVIAITRSSAKTWITVEDEKGRSKRFTLQADVEIEVDGEAGDVSDIEPGDEVTLTLEGNTVIKVVVED